VKPSRIQAIDHVHLEAPPGISQALTWFYAEVAELDFLGGDAAGATRLCFRSERIELRIRITADPWIDSIGCRAVIQVPSLEATVKRLEEGKVSYERLTGIAWTDRRVGVLDPAGNRIELKQEWPQGTF